jgi:hypothetical protein
LRGAAVRNINAKEERKAREYREERMKYTIPPAVR